jgi:formylglycine-generating enzyme required for sulfatase activity
MKANPSGSQGLIHSVLETLKQGEAAKIGNQLLRKLIVLLVFANGRGLGGSLCHLPFGKRVSFDQLMQTNLLKVLHSAGLLLGTAGLVSAQTPATLGLQIFAGVKIMGAAGSVYSVQSTTNIALTNSWGTVAFVQLTAADTLFVDTSAPAIAGSRFYRALLHNPTNMVFVAPDTFTMGSPSNDLGRSVFEGPQAKVTLTRGFWIGTHEVTQGEYLAVTGENPSDFPGDLSRPISSVSWLDASNYCAKLTERELAAGRIPAGTRYRLPTEAEWECAARAGTSTRFSYGDDPDYASLTNHAWYFINGKLTVHPVGQKLPNPLGMYDMEGNVWEWCQDWYGDQLGGVQTDPIGPASNPNGYKVMRGGAYDYFETDCRSAARFFRHFLLTDSDVGFRVVLAGP